MEEENKTKYCILYVDDEEDNLVVFKSAFRRNYNVLTATSAAEGLEIVKHQAVDMIITDQRMPLMTGIQFLKSLPEDIMSIRMILTGYSDIEAVIEAINTGKVYKYITKPWNKDELQITLDKALETLDLKRKNIELVNNLKSANEKLEQKVKDRTLELEQKNKDITDSITYAKRIQESILPEMKNYNANFSEYFVLYKPKDIVSGDFYWLLEKDDDVFFAAV
ncbi:MAG TPA: response regulator, partial [Bacteroidia bacterium]